MIEADAPSIKVDLVCDVVPDVGRQGNVPLGQTVDFPAEAGVGSSLFAIDKAILHLSEIWEFRVSRSIFLLEKKNRSSSTRAVHLCLSQEA